MNQRPNLTIALIEIGTNSLKLMIAGIFTGTKFDILHQSRATTRLGTGLEKAGRIDPADLNRTMETLKAFRRMVTKYQCLKTFTYSTHVLRAAANAPDVIREIEKKTGLEAVVLSAYREAKYAYLSAASRLQMDKPHTVLMDIGGGSTEYVHAHNGQIRGVHSLPLGALYLTERFLNSDLIQRDEYLACDAYIDRSLMEANQVITPPDTSPQDVELVASGGAVATLGRMIAAAGGEEYHPSAHSRIRQTAVVEILKKCLSSPLRQRETIPGLDPDRADIIVAGLAVVLKTMRMMDKPELITNEAGLREGVLRGIIDNNLQWPGETTSRGKA